MQLRLNSLSSKRPFDSPVKQQGLITRLNDIDSMSFPATAINREPTLPLSLLTDKNRLAHLLSVFEWVIVEINKTN